MKCTECSFENMDSTMFCGNCGAVLTQLCSACNYSVNPEQGFCGNCGAPLKGSVTVSDSENSTQSPEQRSAGLPILPTIEYDATPVTSTPKTKKKRLYMKKVAVYLPKLNKEQVTRKTVEILHSVSPWIWVSVIGTALVLIVGFSTANRWTEQILKDSGKSLMLMQQMQADNLLYKKDYVQAQKAFDKLSTMGAHEEAAIGLAQSFLGMGNRVAAEKATRDELKKSPDSLPLQNMLEIILLEEQVDTAQLLYSSEKTNDKNYLGEETRVVEGGVTVRRILPPVEPEPSGFELTGTTEAALVNRCWFVPAGDWMYLVDPSDDCRLYRTKIGSDKMEKVSDAQPFCYNLVGDTLFYSDMVGIWKQSSSGVVEKIYTYPLTASQVLASNGEALFPLIEETSVAELGPQSIRSILFEDYWMYAEADWVYFQCRQREGDPLGIWRMKPDGSGVQPLGDQPCVQRMQVVTPTHFYFRMFQFGKSKGIYRMNRDGTGLEIYIPDESNIYTSNNQILLLRYVKGNDVYCDLGVSYDRNRVLSGDPEGSLLKYINSTDAKIRNKIPFDYLTEDAYYNLLAFSVGDSRDAYNSVLYRTDIITGQSQELCQIGMRGVRGLAVTKDWIYITVNENENEIRQTTGLHRELDNAVVCKLPIGGGKLDKLEK